MAARRTPTRPRRSDTGNTDGDTGDDVTGYAITGGADQSFFSIVPATGVLTFRTAPNYEDPKDSDTGNTYVGDQRRGGAG